MTFSKKVLESDSEKMEVDSSGVISFWCFLGLVALTLIYILKSLIPGFGMGVVDLLVLSFLFVYFKSWVESDFYKVLVPYLFYILVILISTLSNYQYYELSFLNVFSQFLVNVKVILFFGILIRLVKCNLIPLEKCLVIYIKALILINLLMVFFQLVSPNLVDGLFSGMVLDSYIPGTDIRRLTGVFYHPTPLSFFACICLVFVLVYKKSFRYHWLWIAGVIFLLIVSGQRGEPMFLFLSFLMFFLFYRNFKFFIKNSYFSVVISIFISLVAYEFYESGIYEMDNSSMPRWVLYQGAMEIAEQQFPLGGGLSVYGSSNSLESSAYFDLGIDKLWWFVSGEGYITDTFWPMIIGESGYLGLVFYITFILLGYRSLLKTGDGVGGGVLLIFILFQTTTNPIFTGAYYLIYFALMVSLVLLKNYKYRNPSVKVLNGGNI